MVSTKSSRGEKKNGKEIGKTKAIQKSSRNKQESNNKLSNGIAKKKLEVVVVPSSCSESEEEEEEQRTDQRKKSRHDEGEDKEDEMKLYSFPINRISRMLRSEYSDLRINQDALFLISKASEKFVERFTEDAYAVCATDRKKTIGYKHLSSVVSNQKRYDFLSDFVPQQLKAEDALAQTKVTES